MIFNVPGHIGIIRNGLFWYEDIDKPDWSLKGMKDFHTHRTQFLADLLDVSKETKAGLHPIIIKTQTRRVNRGMYYIGSNYAVQSKRGVKAEKDIRIVMDEIWEGICAKPRIMSGSYFRVKSITKEDAWAEGYYTPKDYEQGFRKAYPKWDGKKRWAFKFHVIGVKEQE